MFAVFYLPIFAQACLRVCVSVCICACVQLATCCEVLHVLGACTNASFHFTAKSSLIVFSTGSALAAFMNVKYAAPGQGSFEFDYETTTHAPGK